MYQFGQKLRAKYIDEMKFLPSEYDSDAYRSRSTHKNRTYLSALYQMMGMYPNTTASAEDF